MIISKEASKSTNYVLNKYNTRELTDYIFDYLNKTLRPDVCSYLDAQQKKNGVSDRVDHERQVLRGHLNDWFVKKSPYQPIPDISIVPTTAPLKNLGASKEEKSYGYYPQISNLFDILKLPSVHKFLESVYKMSDNSHFGDLRFNDFLNCKNASFLKKSNEMAQCLIAIELENSTNRKYVLGSLFNASMVGKVGILIYNKENRKKLNSLYENIRKYNRINKADFLKNVLILSHEDFLSSIGYYYD